MMVRPNPPGTGVAIIRDGLPRRPRRAVPSCPVGEGQGQRSLPVCHGLAPSRWNGGGDGRGSTRGDRAGRWDHGSTSWAGVSPLPGFMVSFTGLVAAATPAAGEEPSSSLQPAEHRAHPSEPDDPPVHRGPLSAGAAALPRHRSMPSMTGRGRAQRYQTSGTPRDIPVGQPQRRLEEHRTHDDPAGRRAACDPHPHRPRDGVKVRDKVREIADRYPDVDHDGSATRIARTVTGLAGHGARADWTFAIGQPVTERQTRWRSTAILNG